MVFSKLPSAYEDKKECYVVHIVELFLQQHSFLLPLVCSLAQPM